MVVRFRHKKEGRKETRGRSGSQLLVYITMHHFDFLVGTSSSSSESESSESSAIGGATGLLGTETVGTETPGTGAGTGMNSPRARSKDVRPSSGDLVPGENHPPGKNRDEAVDSRRVRGGSAESVSLALSSFTAVKRGRAALKKRTNLVNRLKALEDRTTDSRAGSSTELSLCGNT